MVYVESNQLDFNIYGGIGDISIATGYLPTPTPGNLIAMCLNVYSHEWAPV